jgi:dTDP-4-dehydrorhamnose 3,5-epimerase
VNSASRFTLTRLPLAGLFRVERQRHEDSRGSFERLFCAEELIAGGWTQPVAQVNYTRTQRRGTVRGLHFQRPPYAEKKLVRCLRGEIWDVAVDLRADSSTFLQWHAETLNERNGALLIPEGFAHGFQALTDDVELLYCHSMAYEAQAEDGLRAQDPRLNIAWPLPITEQSERDTLHRLLSPEFSGLAL